MRLILRLAVLASTAVLITAGCGERSEIASEPDQVTLTGDEARSIAHRAFVYGFPLVVNYKTLYNYSIDTDNPEYKGPFNSMGCVARLFTPDDTAIVTPNADTPYCMAWMDLRAGPLVLAVPELEPERFYHFQLIDLYTHNFDYVGTLTTGNSSNRILVAGPGWNGEKPDDINAIVRSETELIFAIARTQLFGPDDIQRVRDIQESYSLAPLGQAPGMVVEAASAEPGYPPWIEGAQFDERLFTYLNFMMNLIGEPHPSEKELWNDLGKIGLGPDSAVDIESVSADLRAAIAAGARDGLEEIRGAAAELGQDPLGSAKAFGTREFLENSARDNFGHENHYLIRAVAALMGLYGNSAVEAIYPTYLVDADGTPLDGSRHSYTLTFPEGQLPPVRAFWSLTMYDGETQLFVRNPLQRYLLNSTMLNEFVFGDDGSLTLHIASASPDEQLDANWLPAPAGPFYMVLRLYGPKQNALTGKWMPPALQRND